MSKRKNENKIIDEPIPKKANITFSTTDFLKSKIMIGDRSALVLSLYKIIKYMLN